jgi:hypothetical protein
MNILLLVICIPTRKLWHVLRTSGSDLKKLRSVMGSLIGEKKRAKEWGSPGSGSCAA